MKRFLSLLAAFLFIGVPAFAGPLAYINSPLDTPQGLVNTAIQEYNQSAPLAQPTTACTGTTTATCQGIRIAASYTGLTTAAGAASAAQTVTDASVVASSQVFCQVMGYAGTGNPLDTLVIPGAGSFTYVIKNVDAAAALNATVVTVCNVNN